MRGNYTQIENPTLNVPCDNPEVYYTAKAPAFLEEDTSVETYLAIILGVPIGEIRRFTQRRRHAKK